jgi:transcriptional regulator with XRE-family HTH domain
MYKRHPARVRSRIPALVDASGLTEREIEERAARALGHRLDRRTLRHYLDGEVLEAPALTALAAICAALEVSLGDAVRLERAESVDERLQRAGIRVVASASPGARRRLAALSPPAQGWGDTAADWLRERARDL